LHRADGDEHTKIALIKRQGFLPVKEIAVEISDKFSSDTPACRHRVKNLVEQGFGLLISIADVELAQRLAKKAFGQEPYVFGEKAEDKLHHEMGDGLRRVASRLKALRKAGEFVGGLLRHHLARHVSAQFLGIVEDGAQDREFFRIGEIVEGEIEGF
jgi:hypothetical protein